MVKLGAPAGSLDARGKLAGVLSFSIAKGRHTCRKITTPAQPNTNKQLSARAALRFLCNAWSSLSVGEKATWAELAALDDLPPYNAFLRVNLARIAQNRGPCKAYPAAELLGPTNPVVLELPEEVRSCKGEALTCGEDFEWSIFIYRNPTDTFTPEPKYIVDILTATGEATAFYHRPLAPGLYWWWLASGTSDGLLSAPVDCGANTVLP